MLASAISKLDPKMGMSDFQQKLLAIEKHAKNLKDQYIDNIKRTYGITPEVKSYKTYESDKPKTTGVKFLNFEEQ